jgi:hypothetical protein
MRQRALLFWMNPRKLQASEQVLSLPHMFSCMKTLHLKARSRKTSGLLLLRASSGVKKSRAWASKASCSEAA